MLTRKQIEEIKAESREKGVTIKSFLEERGIFPSQYFRLKRKFAKPDIQEGFLPPAPLHKCMADASLLADIVISKYVHHLPFHRVTRTYKELGGSISPSTVNDLFKAVVGKVKPIHIRPA